MIRKDNVTQRNERDKNEKPIRKATVIQISGGLREGSEASFTNKKGKSIGKGTIVMVGTRREIEERKTKRRRERVDRIMNAESDGDESERLKT